MLWRLFVLGLLSMGSVQAAELRVATWNLGWHLSSSEATDWIGRCDALFAKDATTGKFRPAATGTPGWKLRWGRDAAIEWDISARPPCDVFKTGSFETVAVSEAAYRKRAIQIRTILEKSVRADVIAFQEVSGEAAIREVLPEGVDYGVCTFSDHKVQRLGFAWRKTLGDAIECEVESALSLPNLAEKDRVRPGLSVALKADGKTIRLLSVHLKSSCVSPLEGGADQRGVLEGSNVACQTLQQQVKPLETWIERKSVDGGAFVVLGDFNRNLWHEVAAAGPVRTDGSDPKGDLPPAARVRRLLAEVNDSVPASSKLDLAEPGCPINPVSAAICEAAKTTANREHSKELARFENLGCRNPLGLDHVLVGGGAVADVAEKVSIGRLGRTLPPSAARPDALLSVSDHCPLVATIRF